MIKYNVGNLYILVDKVAASRRLQEKPFSPDSGDVREWN